MYPNVSTFICREDTIKPNGKKAKWFKDNTSSKIILNMKNQVNGSIVLEKIGDSTRNFLTESNHQELPSKQEIKNPTWSHQEPMIQEMATTNLSRVSSILMMDLSVEPPLKMKLNSLCKNADMYLTWSQLMDRRTASSRRFLNSTPNDHKHFYSYHLNIEGTFSLHSSSSSCPKC